jgi:anti-sigma B factor antagonist
MSPTAFSYLNSRTEGNVLVITINCPQLQDEKTAQTIQDELLAARSQSGLINVVVDLSNIRYISSVAFRPFLRMRRELQEIGGRLILCGLTRIVGDVFYTTRLVSTDGSFVAPFEMAADVPAAVARLTEGSTRSSIRTD